MLFKIKSNCFFFLSFFLSFFFLKRWWFLTQYASIYQFGKYGFSSSSFSFKCFSIEWEKAGAGIANDRLAECSNFTLRLWKLIVIDTNLYMTVRAEERKKERNRINDDAQSETKWFHHVMISFHNQRWKKKYHLNLFITDLSDSPNSVVFRSYFR